MLQSCLDASWTRASHGETLWTAVNPGSSSSTTWQDNGGTTNIHVRGAVCEPPNTKYSIILSIPSHNCNSFLSSVTEQFRAVVMRCTVLDHCHTTHQSVETSFRFVCAVFCAVHAGEARARSLLRNDGSQIIKKKTTNCIFIHFSIFVLCRCTCSKLKTSEN